MLLTEYNEEKTLKAEYYAGMKAEQERGLRQLMQSVMQGDIPLAGAISFAVATYGITDETDFYKRASDLGFQLPVSGESTE